MPHASQVVVLRHSLFLLLGGDVMDASFCTVAAITMGVLSTLVGVVVGLKLTGKTEVRGDEAVLRHLGDQV